MSRLMKIFVMLCVLFGSWSCTINADTDIVGWEAADDGVDMEDITGEYGTCKKLCTFGYDSYCMDNREKLVCDIVCSNAGWNGFSECLLVIDEDTLCAVVKSCVEIMDSSDRVDGGV